MSLEELGSRIERTCVGVEQSSENRVVIRGIAFHPNNI